jgi:hypothetical protein
LDRRSYNLFAIKSEIRREEGRREEGAFKDGYNSCRVVIA